MRLRISKVINWDGKEYAFVVDSEPNEFCDFCAFSVLCSEVVRHKRTIEESPMKICMELADAENTNYCNFISNDRAQEYVDNMNKRNAS
jgi:hypothetical protein